MTARFISLGAAALVAVAAVARPGPLNAQNGTTNSGPVRLAFGYQCGDTFILHNDGTQPVNIAYQVSGTQAQTPLHLTGGESVSISSPANAPLELWVNGKLAATEPKGNRACAASGNSDVVVRPLASNGAAAAPPPVDSSADAVPLYAPPPMYDYYPAYPYYVPYPYYYYPYPYYGYYPSFGPVVTIRGGFIGGFGRPGIGIGRGIGRGPVIVRGRGRP
ncbi:MAG TPA: hypothetical protein VMH39_16795 [Gemmatimonadaceae bacterium]|nr:hypothetical protein [Gemmatimonadaceae bacterium]